MLCLQFDSPTLGPHFPIPRPIALLSGCIASHWVASHHVGSHHLVLGCITSRWVVSHCVRSRRITSGHVRSHRIASGCVTLCQVASHHVASRHISLGHVASHQVGSHRVGLGQSRYYQVASCYYQPYSVRYPSLLLFPFLHTLFLLFLQRFSLYLHASLFSFCHCSPGRLSLALALPYPCHLSLHYF